MAANIASWAITILVVGSLGWKLGRRRTQATGLLVFGVLAVAAILGLGLGENARLVGAGHVRIYLNRAIFMLCLGSAAGLGVSTFKLRRAIAC